MLRIIKNLKNGNNNVVMGINKSLAEEVYDSLKRVDEQLAIYFWEQYKYYQYTGRLMAA